MPTFYGAFDNPIVIEDHVNRYYLNQLVVPGTHDNFHREMPKPKKKRQSYRHNEWLCKPVYNLETQEIYNSVTTAALAAHVDRKTMIKWLNQPDHPIYRRLMPL